MACDDNVRTGGDFIVEVIIEQRGAGHETIGMAVLRRNFAARADLRLQIRTADRDDSSLSGHAIDAFVQIVEAGYAIAAADATLQGPVFGRVPDEIGARADLATKSVVMIVATA